MHIMMEHTCKRLSLLPSIILSIAAMIINPYAGLIMLVLLILVKLGEKPCKRCEEDYRNYAVQQIQTDSQYNISLCLSETDNDIAHIKHETRLEILRVQNELTNMLDTPYLTADRRKIIQEKSESRIKLIQERSESKIKFIRERSESRIKRIRDISESRIKRIQAKQ